MGFLKSIFGGKQEPESVATPVDSKFQTLKFDGVRARNMGEFPFAVRCFHEALSLQPSDLETKSYLAEAYMRVAQPEKAYPLFLELTQNEPDNVPLWIMLAQAAEQNSDWTAMQEACEHVVKQNPDNAVAHYLFAKAYDGQKDDFQAIAQLTTALVLEAHFELALLLRAQLLLRMNQYAEAEKDVDVLLQNAEPSEETLLLKGDLRHAVTDMEGAAMYYQQAIEVNPFSSDAILKCGGLYVETNQLDKALHLYDEAIANQPNFAAAYQQRGGVKRMLKDELGAVDDLKRSLELAPEALAEVEGEFTNVENRIEEEYKARNPYGF
ncbi:MAG: hypothetical protein RR386_00465 [Bacteroidaceae bacterium]